MTHVAIDVITFNLICAVVGGRAPKMGPDTFEILSEEAICVYLNYYNQLKLLFTQYNH